MEPWLRSSAENKHPTLITRLYLLRIQAKYFFLLPSPALPSTHAAYLSLSLTLPLLCVTCCLPLIILAVINRFWFKPPFRLGGRWRWNVAASSAHQCVTTRWCARSPGCCRFFAVLTAPSNILISAFTLIACTPPHPPLQNKTDGLLPHLIYIDITGLQDVYRGKKTYMNIRTQDAVCSCLLCLHLI